MNFKCKDCGKRVPEICSHRWEQVPSSGNKLATFFIVIIILGILAAIVVPQFFPV